MKPFEEIKRLCDDLISAEREGHDPDTSVMRRIARIAEEQANLADISA